MELSIVAHQRLVEAGWELERFEESDFGKSAEATFQRVSIFTAKKVKVGIGTIAAAVVTTVGATILQPYALVGAPFALGFAFKELIVPMRLNAVNSDLLQIQRRSHYIEEAAIAIEKSFDRISAAKRPEMTKLVEKIIKQWKNFNDLIPVVASTSSDKMDLLVHKTNLTQSLRDLAKVSPGRKDAKRYEKAKEEVCDTLKSFQENIGKLADSALNSSILVQGILFSHINP